MPISFEQATVYLALAKKHAEGKDVAMAFDAEGKITGFGVSDGRTTYDSRSALINLLQNETAHYAHIGCTSKPTERDLGMARMAMVTRINYLDGDDLKFVRRAKRSFDKPWQAAAALAYNQATDVGLAAPASKKPDKANEWYTANVQDGRPVQQPPQAPLHAMMSKASKSFVGAKKYTHFVRQKTKLDLPNLSQPDEVVRNDPNAVRDQIFMCLAWAVVGEAIGVRNNNGKYPTGHSIGSVFRGPNDEILGFGLNTNHEQWSLHGEVNLLQTHQDDDAVDGAEIGKGNVSKPIMYTTLEPCFMCAGMYFDAGQNLQCKYGQADAGIDDSVLEVNHRQAHLVSPIGTAAAVAFELKRQAAPRGRYAITKFLNIDFDAALQLAVDKYFDLVPAAPVGNAQPSAQRDNWTKNVTLESHIWENGIKLLYHINNGVLAKWQASNKHYAIVGFERV